MKNEINFTKEVEKANKIEYIMDMHMEYIDERFIVLQDTLLDLMVDTLVSETKLTKQEVYTSIHVDGVTVYDIKNYTTVAIDKTTINGFKAETTFRHILAEIRDIYRHILSDVLILLIENNLEII